MTRIERLGGRWIVSGDGIVAETPDIMHAFAIAFVLLKKLNITP